MDALDWPQVIVSVVLLFGVGQRVAQYLWRQRRVLDIVCEVLERLSAAGAPEHREAARTAKGVVDEATRELGGEVREIAERAAAAAEAKRATPGSAGKRVARESKAKRALKWIGRLVPIFGLFV